MVLTNSGVVVRKATDIHSKLHFMLSLKYPVSIVPSDTLSIGLNGVILRGFCPKTLFTTEAHVDDEIMGSSVANGASTTVAGDSEEEEEEVVWGGDRNIENMMNRGSSASVTRNKKARFREVVERQLELGFDTKDSQSEWIDAILEQYQLLTGI
jgi:hypothetical protein